MNDILRDHLDLTAVGILDDVIISSEDPALHVRHDHAILQILRDNKLHAKVEKCEFDKDSVTAQRVNCDIALEEQILNTSARGECGEKHYM